MKLTQLTTHEEKFPISRCNTLQDLSNRPSLIIQHAVKIDPFTEDRRELLPRFVEIPTADPLLTTSNQVRGNTHYLKLV